MNAINKDGLLLCNIQATAFEKSVEKLNSSSEIFWIGYIYRYFAITYELTSAQVYKIVKPKELREVFLSYHTLDPAQAIERILEAKGMLLDDAKELERQYKIYRKIRKS